MFPKDWNEILCDKNTDRKKAIAETITIKVPEAEELVPMLCYEDIEPFNVIYQTAEDFDSFRWIIIWYSIRQMMKLKRYM